MVDVDDALHYRCGVELTMLKKIGAGYFLAAMAMVAAGLVERARLGEWHDGHIVGNSICAKKDEVNPPQMVSLSIFYQIIQFGLVGSSEVLASVTGLEFFYTQAPESMKSVCAALNLLTTAIGTWLMAALIPVVNSSKGNEWIAHDLNHGHMDYFFFTMAGNRPALYRSSTFTLMTIVGVCRWYAIERGCVHLHLAWL